MHTEHFVGCSNRIFPINIVDINVSNFDFLISPTISKTCVLQMGSSCFSYFYPHLMCSYGIDNTYFFVYPVLDCEHVSTC